MLTDTIIGQIAMVAMPSLAENIIGVDSGVATAILIMELATRMISVAPVINVSTQVVGKAYRTAHQISAGSGNARLPAPPITTDANTEIISAMTGSNCSRRSLSSRAGIRKVSIHGTTSTPVENCSLNQSANSGQNVWLSIPTDPVAPSKAQSSAAIRQ